MKSLIAMLPFLAASAGAATGLGGVFVFSHPPVPPAAVEPAARPLPSLDMPAPETRASSPLPVPAADEADDDVEGCG